MRRPPGASPFSLTQSESTPDIGAARVETLAAYNPLCANDMSIPLSKA